MRSVGKGAPETKSSLFIGVMPTIKKSLKTEIKVLQNALMEIQSLYNTLTPEDPNQLETDLGDLESKISS